MTLKPAKRSTSHFSDISSYLERSSVNLRHLEIDQTYYQPSTDTVTLPLRSQFRSTAEYYSAAFHELTHSTGNKSRLDRLEKTAFFGSEAYSKEELIAEIGAAALVNHVGLETAGSFRNNAAYIQNRLQVLRNDNQFIVSASGKTKGREHDPRIKKQAARILSGLPVKSCMADGVQISFKYLTLSELQIV